MKITGYIQLEPEHIVYDQATRTVRLADDFLTYAPRAPVVTVYDGEGFVSKSFGAGRRSAEKEFAGRVNVHHGNYRAPAPDRGTARLKDHSPATPRQAPARLIHARKVGLSFDRLCTTGAVSRQAGPGSR